MKKKRKKEKTAEKAMIFSMLVVSGILFLFWIGWGVSFALGISPSWINWLTFGILTCLHIFWIGYSWWIIAVISASGPRGLFLNPAGTWIDGIIWMILWPILASLKLITMAIMYRRVYGRRRKT